MKKHMLTSISMDIGRPNARVSSLRSNTRSQRYQHIFAEQSVDSQTLNDLFYEQTEQSQEIKEKLMDLKDQLAAETRKLAQQILTETQLQCYLLTAEGLTQAEIGSEIGVDQSSIHTAINGRVKEGRITTGLITKLQLAANDSNIIQEILRQIAELTEE